MAYASVIFNFLALLSIDLTVSYLSLLWIELYCLNILINAQVHTSMLPGNGTLFGNGVFADIMN